jgi:phosphoribosylformylglycinamidine (FGAM) synthase PurS component
VRLGADSPEQAEQRLQQMCEALLANTLIESYTVEVGAPEEAAR